MYYHRMGSDGLGWIQGCLEWLYMGAYGYNSAWDCLYGHRSHDLKNSMGGWGVMLGWM